jgi:pimeloyl-ACP methyl ester carboxylesterase
MAKPQQPELHRSGRGATDPASAKAVGDISQPHDDEDTGGPVPAANRPGHHPQHEQDKPERPPRPGVRRKPTSAKAANLTTAIEIPVGPHRFRALAAGPANGEVVFLLHGFPQTSAAWRPQLTALAKAGYRAIAPDQRGYSPNARPEGASEYRLERLVDDVVGMAEEVEADGFHIVGHDWGGAVAWAAAAAHPDRIFTATIVSTPHPRAFMDAIRRGPQALRSIYVGFFAMPFIPEFVLGANHAAGLRRMLVSSGLPAEIAETYAGALSDRSALTAALNWYRGQRPSDANAVGEVTVPTLSVWSDRDPALGRAAATGSGRYVKGEYRFEVLHGANHWIPETRPDALTELLLEHLAEDRPTRLKASRAR